MRNKRLGFLERENRMLLEDSLSVVSPRDAMIARWRLGICGIDGSNTLSGISKKIGVSPERVRQIEARVARKLWHGLGYD